jgi:hypothetical protein
MFDVLRVDQRRTALIFLVVTVVAVIYLALITGKSLDTNAGQFGVPTDDTWIQVRFASHVANGDGFSFNPGTLSNGATSPLWVLLLAPFYAIFNPDNTGRIVIAAVLSSIGFILTAWSITGLSWWLTQRAWVGLAAGLLTVLTGRLVWFALSGMETTTFIALTIITVWSHLDDLRALRPSGWRTGVLAGITTLAWPGGYLLTAIIMFDSVIAAIRREKTWSAAAKTLLASWRAALTYLLLAGSYLVLYASIAGYPFPNILRAQTQFGREFPALLDSFATPLEDFGIILLLLVVAGMFFLAWSTWRGQIPGWTLVLWPNLLILAVLLAGKDQYKLDGVNGYVAPAIPFQILALLVTCVALSEFVEKHLPDQRTKQIIVLGAAVAIPFSIFAQGYGIATRIPADVHLLLGPYMQAAEFIKAWTRSDQLIAANDVGIIGQVSDRPVLDLIGLVSPEVTAMHDGSPPYTCPYDLQLARVMLREPPVLISIFPEQYPCLSRWPGAWKPLEAFSSGEGAAGVHPSMVVGAPVWENWPMLRSVPIDTRAVNTVFDQGIELAGYRAAVVDEGLKITLWWRVHGTPTNDYHVYLHMFDASGNLLGQHDDQPQSDQFRTSWWRSGDIIRDEHLIPLQDLNVLDQPGLSLGLGLYNASNSDHLLIQNPAPGAPSDTVTIPLKIDKNPQ